MGPLFLLLIFTLGHIDNDMSIRKISSQKIKVIYRTLSICTSNWLSEKNFDYYSKKFFVGRDSNLKPTLLLLTFSSLNLEKNGLPTHFFVSQKIPLKFWRKIDGLLNFSVGVLSFFPIRCCFFKILIVVHGFPSLTTPEI